jgi:adenylate cyclase
MERRLAAILSADVVGYSRLMGADEAGTLGALIAHRKELIDPKIAEHNGRIVKLMGDGALVEFASVVEAVHCAVAIQEGMAERNTGVADDRRIAFRIGINVGDVIVEADDIYGDGVNVAARLEGLAEPGGICVSRAVRDQVRDKLDLALDDLGEVEVKNIARPVRAFRVRAEPGVVAATTKRPRKAWLWPAFAAVAAVGAAMLGAVAWWQPWTRDTESVSIERPSDLPAIAVLPFDNMSGDPAQDYFSDGITEDLITDLSRISGLFVIARTTMFSYKGKPITVRQVGDELGVQYVLEGSVRKAGNRVRINAQLINVRGGHHVWADRFDRELTDVFALQDEVTQRIVSALAVKLTVQEEERLNQAAKAHPEAYDTLLRGLERLRRYTREANAEARLLFEKAISLDPEFARAYADLAYTRAIDVVSGWSDDPDEDVQRAAELIDNAIALDDSIPQVHFARSVVYRLQGRHDEAIAAARQAVAFDPNYADGYAVLAISLNYVGRPEEGLAAIQTAMRLNPRHPFFYVWIKGQAYFLMEDYTGAVAEFENVVESNPHFPRGHLMLAAAYGQVGRIDDAEWAATEVLTLLPDFSIEKARQTTPYKNPADMERYIEGLRKAGVPE